jgi:hypothetical protein
MGCLALLAAVSVGQAQMQEFSGSRASDAGEPAAVPGGAAAANTLATNSFQIRSNSLPFEYGVVAQGGFGVTENRSDFKFLMAGVHAGKVLYSRDKPGLLQGNFEYAAELFPFWQSYTPKFQRANCVLGPVGQGNICSPLYTTGGTFTGVTVTPIILRWNFASRGKIVPWAQGAGGLLWTNHKYPAFGSPVLTLANDGPNTDASVFNFTPQGGVGLHYFLSPERSIDFGANAVHISSASLGDRNPGVNASVQFTVGYTFWK